MDDQMRENESLKRALIMHTKCTHERVYIKPNKKSFSSIILKMIHSKQKVLCSLTFTLCYHTECVYVSPTDASDLDLVLHSSLLTQ